MSGCKPNSISAPPGGPVLVVFEGLDGSGKSAVSRRTAELLGAVWMTTPSPAMRAVRDTVLADLGSCQEGHQLFYLATVAKASNEIAQLLARGRSVVLDRYFLSTQAYAEVRGSTLRLDDLASSFVPATATVYLDAPLETRRARIEVRGPGSAADRETLQRETSERLREAHVRRAALAVVGRWLCLASGVATVDALAREVIVHLGV